jgi:hypothetical protein
MEIASNPVKKYFKKPCVFLNQMAITFVTHLNLKITVKAIVIQEKNK